MARVSKITIFKALEVIIQCTLLWTMTEVNFSNVSETLEIVTGAFHGGYCIVLVGIWVGFFMNSPVSRRVDVYFSVLGAFLHFYYGVFLLMFLTYDNKFNNYEKAMIQTILSLVQGVIFGLDSFLTYKGSKN